MSSIAVLGCMWGDEAKAKIVDYLGDQTDVVIRFQGGSNAGHTICLDGEKYVFHAVPSGILYPKTICVIAAGVVIDPIDLLSELDDLKAKGLDFEGRLLIDERAGIVLPIHRQLDQVFEAGSSKIGTTKRGIGPAYADLTSRIGIRMLDLKYPQWLRERIKNIYMVHQITLSNAELELQLSALADAWKKLGDHVVQADLLLHDWQEEGKRLLFEGAQGTLLDISYGTYPYVTSSHTMSGGISTGSGMPLRQIENILGVYKAYCTRVGDGPFPTELYGSIGDQIRSQGNEFGSTTGRPRRCGWFDAVAASYTARINGLDSIAITLLDVLSGIPELQICTGYWTKGDSPTRLKGFPSHPLELAEVQAEYLNLKGWDKDISNIKRVDKLPKTAQEYLEAIQDLLELPISLVSVGKDRTQTIVIK